MDFEFTEAQKALVAMVREFAQKEVKPVCIEKDRESKVETYPLQLVKRASALGIRTLALDEEFGGGGADELTLILCLEELAAADLGFAITLDQTWKYTPIITKFMTREQRDRWLPRFVEDDAFLLAIGCTEPDAGSDNILPYDDPKAGMKLMARKVSGGWQLNGTKHFISIGNVAKLLFIMARTDRTVGVSQGSTMFAVPQGAEGFTIGKIENKIGQRSTPNAELVFNNCFVPDNEVIGEVNKGIELLARVGLKSRPKMSGLALGVARAAFEETLEWCKNRIQGGRPIIEHQAVQIRLSEMLAKLEAARSITWRAAWAAEYQEPYDPNIANAAKLFVTHAAVEIAITGMQLFGGYGIIRDMPIEKLVRDSLTTLHMDGTNELLGMAMAQAMAGIGKIGWGTTVR